MSGPRVKACLNGGRAGLEDSATLPDGNLPRGNADLVAAAAEIVHVRRFVRTLPPT